MTDKVHTPILPEGMAVANVVNPQGRAPIVLICEHASDYIPPGLNDLGLSSKDRFSHAVVDIGAEALARRLSETLDAPLVLARVSRLVCDLNRPPASTEASPALVENIEIPGNLGLTETDRVARADAVYYPFHDTAAKVIAGRSTAPALVTIHSFTPTWLGKVRDTEIGLLHDQDDSLAKAMLTKSGTRYRTELNRPYDASDGVTHTLQKHGNGLQNVMIEVRNDILAKETSIPEVAEILAAMLKASLVQEASR